jgi:uncharacterized protein with LGFP repeats
MDAERDGRFQEFQTGMIIWRPNEAWVVRGAILAHYRARGSEGSWGFPTMDEQDAGASPGGTRGRYQYMQGGLFMWSAPTGAHLIHGAILQTFESNGREAELGYPTSDEIAEGSGVRQTFQNATIHWTPEQGTRISRT